MMSFVSELARHNSSFVGYFTLQKWRKICPLQWPRFPYFSKDFVVINTFILKRKISSIPRSSRKLDLRKRVCFVAQSISSLYLLLFSAFTSSSSSSSFSNFATSVVATASCNTSVCSSRDRWIFCARLCEQFEGFWVLTLFKHLNVAAGCRRLEHNAAVVHLRFAGGLVFVLVISQLSFNPGLWLSRYHHLDALNFAIGNSLLQVAWRKN